MVADVPFGIHILSKIFKFEYKNKRRLALLISVFILTFISYASLHAGRKPLAVAKSKLHGRLTDNNTYIDGWNPFDTNKSGVYFAGLDASWTFAYAIGMFFTGQLAEHYSLRFFLFFGLVGSGCSLCAIGLAFYLKIHSFAYFVSLQVISGIFQSAGWPCIVPIMANWVPPEKRGSVFGIWNSHSAVGNIIGQSISSILVEKSWGLSFIIIGIICFFVSVIVILFLATSPQVMGFIEEKSASEEKITLNADEQVTKKASSTTELPPIGFLEALRISGVIEYSFCLFFCKFVIYTFLFWLPFYIRQVGIIGHSVSPATAGHLATLFDIGGIVGGIAVGFIQDVFKKNGIICFMLQVASAISLFIYSKFGNQGYNYSIVMLFISGAFVNAPNSIITGTISANFGDVEIDGKKKKAGSTVAAIVDGVGSLGAAIAPFAINKVSTYGWNYVMYLLMASCTLSGLFITRLVYWDIMSLIVSRKSAAEKVLPSKPAQELLITQKQE